MKKIPEVPTAHSEIVCSRQGPEQVQTLARCLIKNRTPPQRRPYKNRSFYDSAIIICGKKKIVNEFRKPVGNFLYGFSWKKQYYPKNAEITLHANV